MFQAFRFGVFTVLMLFVSPSLLRAQSDEGPARTPLRVLAIGNSFSGNATAFLPELAKASGNMLLVRNVGGAGGTLQGHLRAAMKYDADPGDPDGRLYPIHIRKGETRRMSLRELLEFEPWDFVTIQQVSSLSFKPESHRPHAKELADYIRRHAPQAKILIHQTWAYRFDHPLFADGNMTPRDMYDALEAAYNDTAREIDATGVIPVGKAFQNVLHDPRWKEELHPPFQPGEIEFPQLPNDPHSLYTGYYWHRLVNPPRLTKDSGHASVYGRYLGAAVWHEFFFGDVRDNTFIPKNVSPEDAALLRQIAHDTVSAWPGRLVNAPGTLSTDMKD